AGVDDKINVIFTVEDTGIGMTPEFLNRIFTPFERAQDSRISQITGTGLGMAITKNIVDMMAGTIQVESQVGVGSKFTVTLPFTTTQTTQTKKVPLAGCSVLVVDDDPDTCQGLRMMLERENVQVRCAYTGQQGIDAALLAHQEGHDYLGIIMDWRMEGLNGIEAARQIRARIPSEIPII
ncbi:histidine kinase, partial [human gut metagenome]